MVGRVHHWMWRAWVGLSIAGSIACDTADTAELESAAHVLEDDAYDAEAAAAVPQRLHVFSSGQVLGIQGASIDNAAAAIQSPYQQQDSQHWRTVKMKDGSVAYANVRSGKCLDLASSRTEDGAPIIQWDCHYQPNQRWTLKRMGQSVRYQLINQASGKCIEVPKGSKIAGAVTQQATCRPGLARQQWTLKPADKAQPPPPLQPQQGGYIPGITYTNPLIVGDRADPFILVDNGTYHVYWTGIGAAASTTLAQWAPEGMPWAPGQGPGPAPYWAPEVHKIGQAYFFFYTGGWPPGHGYIAVGPTPTGPWSNYPTVLNTLDGIDYSLFVDDDGTYYVYWNQAAAGGIHGAVISPDLRTISRHTFLFSNASQPESWVEGGAIAVNEGPFMVKHKGVYYLTYSANGNIALYGIGAATSTNPLGPFVKSPANPVMQVNGSGGQSFFKTLGGQLMVTYHVNTPVGRSTCIDPVSFVPNPAGGPELMRIAGPTTTPQPVPR